MFGHVGRSSGIGVFLVHLLTATVGTLLITGLLALLLEQIIRRDVVSAMALGPFFLLPIVSGIVLGYYFTPMFPSRGANWVWVVPALVLVVNITGALSSPYERKNVWVNEFGPQSRCTACLDEPLITAPFFGCIGYAVGASIRTKRSRSPLRMNDKHGGEPNSDRVQNV
jgi:hypothetical protein